MIYFIGAHFYNCRFLLIPLFYFHLGEVPDLFSDEDMDGIIAGIRNELRGFGLIDTRENCWNFFLDRVRLQLKVRICIWESTSLTDEHLGGLKY